MYSASNRAEKKAIMDGLIGLIVPVTTIPLAVALGLPMVMAAVAYACGLDGLEYGTSIMSETAAPMAMITVKMMLAVYLALVLFFCHCWDQGTNRIFAFTRTFIRDLLRSANFLVLLPKPTNCSLATSALDLPTLICTSRPKRERPQFIVGDDPPLIYN